MSSRRPFDAQFGDALIAFNDEVMLYCENISDAVAVDYAVDYARSLQTRARGIAVAEPKAPLDLFEPTRNWIRAQVEHAYRSLAKKIHRGRS